MELAPGIRLDFNYIMQLFTLLLVRLKDNPRETIQIVYYATGIGSLLFGWIGAVCTLIFAAYAVIHGDLQSSNQKKAC